MKTPKRNLNLNHAGVTQLNNISGVGIEYPNVVLKPCGDFHSPYIRDSNIDTCMFKITGIPINLMNTTLKAINNLNSLNLFYAWGGDLGAEINERLILVNLF